MDFNRKTLRVFLFISILFTVSCGPSKSTKTVNESDLPSWVNNYKMIYPESSYISSLGISEYKSMAENQAYQGIGSSFEMMIKSTQNSNEVTTETNDSFSQTYKEVFNINTSVDQNLKNIKTSELYFDQANKKYYVLATLNKSETASIYKQERTEIEKSAKYSYQSAQSTDDDLEKLSYLSQCLAQMALVEEIDAKLLILENSSISLLKFKSIPELLNERKQVQKRINVFIQENDDKIYKELKTEMTEMGFKVVDDKELARVFVNGNLELENSSVINQDAKFVNWLLNIEIVDLKNNSAIAHYIAKGRSSQLSESAAKERAYYDLSKKLNAEFEKYLIENLLKTKK
jgi:hypothetical protein